MHRFDTWVSADDREPPVGLWGVQSAGVRPWWSRLVHRTAPDAVARSTAARFILRPNQDLALAAANAHLAEDHCRWCVERSPWANFGFLGRTGN